MKTSHHLPSLGVYLVFHSLFYVKKRLIFTISAALHSFSFPIHLLGKLLCLFDVWRQTYLYTAAAARVFQSVWTFTFDRNTVAARALQKTIMYRVSESDKEVN